VADTIDDNLRRGVKWIIIGENRTRKFERSLTSDIRLVNSHAWMHRFCKRACVCVFFTGGARVFLPHIHVQDQSEPLITRVTIFSRSRTDKRIISLYSIPVSSSYFLYLNNSNRFLVCFPVGRCRYYRQIAKLSCHEQTYRHQRNRFVKIIVREKVFNRPSFVQRE